LPAVEICPAKNPPPKAAPIAAGSVVIELLAALAGLVPVALVAVTVNVYAVTAVKPVTVIGDVPVPVSPPGLDVAVNVTVEG
jgi:hypothetical protein